MTLVGAREACVPGSGSDYVHRPGARFHPAFRISSLLMFLPELLFLALLAPFALRPGGTVRPPSRAASD